MSSIHKRALLAIVAAAVLTTFVVGCGRGTVAKVNGRKITRQEYYKRLERTPYSNPVAPGQTIETGVLVLQQLITEELILRLAEKENVGPTQQQVKQRVAYALKQPAVVNEMKATGTTKDELRERMRVDQAGFNLQTRGVKVTGKEVKDFYEKYKDTQFTSPEQADVAAIFTANKSQMDKAMGLLEKGGVDFGTVARTLSTDPASARRDGRFARAIMRGDQSIPESVQDLVLSTARNKYTKPIPYGDSGGYVVFKVLMHRPKKTRKFGEVEYFIRQQLMVNKGLEKKIDLNQELNDYRKTAKIEISIERYEKLLVPEEEKEAGAEKKTEEKETKK